jgi:hypothetical protein
MPDSHRLPIHTKLFSFIGGGSTKVKKARRRKNRIHCLRGSGYWTSTSLFSVLAYWGDRFDQMAVYCDDAKPLQKSPIFQHFVNRQDKAYQTLWGYECLLTPNLAHPVNLVESHPYAGIPLADILASSCRKALQDPKDPEHKRWIETLVPRISQESVWYDAAYMDVSNRETAVNMLVLHELIERSVKGQSLLTDIERFVYRATILLPIRVGDFTCGPHLQSTV